MLKEDISIWNGDSKAATNARVSEYMDLPAGDCVHIDIEDFSFDLGDSDLEDSPSYLDVLRRDTLDDHAHTVFLAQLLLNDVFSFPIGHCFFCHAELIPLASVSPQHFVLARFFASLLGVHFIEPVGPGIAGRLYEAPPIGSQVEVLFEFDDGFDDQWLPGVITSAYGTTIGVDFCDDFYGRHDLDLRGSIVRLFS